MVGWVLNRPAVARVGRMSYSIYLVQQPFMNHVSRPWLRTLPLNLVWIAIASAVSYRFVE